MKAYKSALPNIDINPELSKNSRVFKIRRVMPCFDIYSIFYLAFLILNVAMET